MRAACKRHIDDIVSAPDRGYVFDPTRADRLRGFYADVLHLNVGEAQSAELKPFILQPPQLFIGGSVFGWVNAETGMRRFRTAYVEQGKGNGKALAIDTPIPTPNGWTLMGHLKVGDQVFDDQGHPCTVTATSGVMTGRPCYRLTFSDGVAIVADADHLWRTKPRRTNGRHDPSRRKEAYSLWTTEEISRTFFLRQTDVPRPAKFTHRVDVAPSICCGHAALPAPPELIGECLSAIDRRKLLSLSEAAVSVMCIVSGDHRIPDEYLRGSTQQRRRLLQALMDGSGECTVQGTCVLKVRTSSMVPGCVELVRSLGFKAKVDYRPAKTPKGTKTHITFRAFADDDVFRTSKYKARLVRRPEVRPISRGRMIVKCEAVDSVPVQCISVDSESRMFLAGDGFVPTHNSPFAAGLGLYGTVADDEPGAECYAAAANLDQALIMFRDAVSMRDQSPVLRAALVKHGGSRCTNLSYAKRGAFFRAITASDGKSGPRPHFALVDELHEHKDSDVVDMLSAGQKGRRQPLIVEITNSGFDKMSVCYAHHEYSIRVVEGLEQDDTWFAYVCALDKGDDPFKDSSCWIKANPLLGVTIKPEYLEKQVREAIGMPSKQSTVRRLNFCEWVDAKDPWIDGPTWLAIEQDFDALQELAECDEVVAAIDLSGTLDLTSLAMAGRKLSDPEQFIGRAEFWTPADTLSDRARTDKAPYELWKAQGYINATSGRSVDYSAVAERILDLKTLLPQLRLIAFDPYRIKYLERELQDLQIEIELRPHPQGYFKPLPKKDESGNEIPVLWMPRSIEVLSKKVVDKKLRVQRNPCLTWNAASAVLETDSKNNAIFQKRKSYGRIDGIVALAMAVGLLDLGGTIQAGGDPQIRWL